LRLEKLAKDKQPSLLGLFVSYEEDENDVNTAPADIVFCHSMSKYACGS
jgi:hypothetical protein